jgi:prepilin-type N-terminal cleavage/methylation domain-containing protein
MNLNPMSDRDGFTLVELIMVMVLIGIMAGIVAPLLRPERFQLNGAVVQVGSTFSAQQRNAVLRQHNIVLAFDTAAGEIRVHYDLDNDNAMDAGENFSVIQLDDGVVFGRGSTPARPLSNSTISFTGTQAGLPAMTFRRNGSASEEAIVYLTSQRSRTSGGTTFAEDGRAVEIERATGRVRCYSYASGAWLQTC